MSDIWNFETGYYLGKRVSLEHEGKYEFYGRYYIEVVEPAKDGTPRVKIDGGRPRKVFGHSRGVVNIVGAGRINIDPAVMVYAPDKDYHKRFPCDDVTISAYFPFK